jgi:hypothetical protein
VNRQQTTETPLSSPEQGTAISMETEPLVGFGPLLAGMAKPGRVQPLSSNPLLEEEPAVWPRLASDAL